jgi:hypothetical protein
VSSSVVMTVPGVTRLPTLTRRQAETSREGRADDEVVEARLRGGDVRGVHLLLRLERIELEALTACVAARTAAGAAYWLRLSASVAFASAS